VEAILYIYIYIYIYICVCSVCVCAHICYAGTPRCDSRVARVAHR